MPFAGESVKVDSADGRNVTLAAPLVFISATRRGGWWRSRLFQ